MHYILIKLIQHHGPCFYSQNIDGSATVSEENNIPRYGAPGDKWIWFNRKIRRSNLRRNFLTKWKNWPDDDDVYVEMEQTICGKMETSSILPLFELQLTQIWQRKTKYLFNIYPKTAAWIWMTQKIPNILEDLHLSDGSKKLQHGEPWLGNCLGETMELSSRWCSEEKEGWQKHKTLPNTQV